MEKENPNITESAILENDEEDLINIPAIEKIVSMSLNREASNKIYLVDWKTTAIEELFSTEGNNV